MKIKGQYIFDKNKLTGNDEPIFCFENAYSISNEPLNDIMQLVPIQGKRILTVAASGDHPILYAANGAAHVDTFDIRYTAKMIMDFKVAASQFMCYDEYITQITKIHNLAGKNKDINFMRAVEQMPKDTCSAMRQCLRKRHDVFYNQDSGTKVELEAMYGNYCTWSNIRNNVKSPFDFIWCDLEYVDYYIQGTYDIINISNILDHYHWHYYKSEFSIYRTMDILATCLNRGGYIICTSCDKDTLSYLDTYDSFKFDSDARIVKRFTTPHWTAIAFRLVR